MGKFLSFLTGAGLALSVSQNFRYKVCYVTDHLDMLRDTLNNRPVNFSYPIGFKDDKELENIKNTYKKN